MAKGVTTDIFGIETITGDALEAGALKMNNEQQVAPGTDEIGDIKIRTVFEALCKPTQDFSVKAACDVDDIKLGLLVAGTTGQQELVIGSVAITTQAGTPPSVTVSGESVTDGQTQGRQYAIPAFSLSPLHKAQILFSAFTLAGTDCYLKSCSATLRVTISRGKGGTGETNSYDCFGGELEVSAEITKLGSTAATITPAEGWTVSKPVNATARTTADESPEDYELLTITLVKSLAIYTPA